MKIKDACWSTEWQFNFPAVSVAGCALVLAVVSLGTCMMQVTVRGVWASATLLIAHEWPRAAAPQQ